MERKPYSAGAVSNSFWFLEFKKAVTLLSEGLTLEDIKKKSNEENLFAAASAARAKNILGATLMRIKALDESFIPLFVKSDVSGQKLICLVACMCSDTLFFDFVYEVIRSKIILGLNSYDDSDIRKFWASKQEQSEKVASFSELSYKRLASVYKVYLAESGITNRTTSARDIYKPVIAPDIEQWLHKNNLQPIIAALTGE